MTRDIASIAAEMNRLCRSNDTITRYLLETENPDRAWAGEMRAQIAPQLKSVRAEYASACAAEMAASA